MDTMSNYDTDLTDLDPTEDDLFAEVDEDFADVAEADDSADDLDFDSNYEDDRYSGNGLPAWSLFR